MEKNKVESRTEMWAKGTGSWLGVRHQKGEKCFAKNYGFRACNGSGQLGAGYDEAEEQMTCIFFDRRATRPSVPEQGESFSKCPQCSATMWKVRKSAISSFEFCPNCSSEKDDNLALAASRSEVAPPQNMDTEWEKNVHAQLDTLGAPRADSNDAIFSINGRFAHLRRSPAAGSAERNAIIEECAKVAEACWKVDIMSRHESMAKYIARAIRALAGTHTDAPKG